MNNFQKLEAKKIEEFPDATRHIKKRVDNTLDVYKFVGNIFDLYFPKIIGFMNTILGGTTPSQSSSRYPNRP